MLSEHVASQTEEHALYGGVVPEIAARAHVERLDSLVRLAMEDAGVGWAGLSGVAATAGPGLIGGVMAGLSTAKAIALARGLPLIAVNHLEGHALSPRLARGGALSPTCCCWSRAGIASSCSVEGVGQLSPPRLDHRRRRRRGLRQDRQAARPLRAGRPCRRARGAARAIRDAVDLPRPLLDRPGLDMSFSGLKTAVRRAAEEQPLTPQRRADICASFQAAVADILAVKSARAMEHGCGAHRPPHLRRRRRRRRQQDAARAPRSRSARAGFRFFAPPLRWCTDNGAMIALAGAERLRLGFIDPLDTPARARWPLDEASATAAPVYGGGKKGAKA